jgi:hypothetical protein
MVFTAGILQLNALNKIKQIWDQAINHSSEAGLLLALQNISKYTYITSEGEVTLHRKDMLGNFYIAEVPLLPLYQKLVSKSHSSSVVNDKIHELKVELRKRKKCALMNDEEYNTYISKLPISLYIPKEMQRDSRGRLYSTLPTSKLVGANMFINIPLELSTGRNEILEGSTFNQAIWKVVFGSDDISVYSEVNYLLCNLMARFSELDIYRCFSGNVDEYISMISQGNEDDAIVKRRQLSILPLFRSYPSGKPVSLCSSYTAEKIVYEYLYSDVKPKKIFDEWICEIQGNEKMSLLSLRNGDFDQINELNSIASNIGEENNRFPMARGDKYMSLSYFESEYGTNKEEGQL